MWKDGCRIKSLASNACSVLAVEVSPRMGCKLHTHTPDFITTMESQWVPFFRQSRPRIPPGYFCGWGHCVHSWASVYVPSFFFVFFLSSCLIFPMRTALAGGGGHLWTRPVKVAVLVAWWENRLAGVPAHHWG